MQITKLSTRTKLDKKLLVCAYARVSNDKDAMLHSLSAQVNYYKDYITSNKEWLFVQVYYDEGISGTKNDRPAFQQMIKDAKEGKINLIITKSISRFARNTVTLLETIRELKKYNVDVYFEEQKIHSISGDGELMLTILASYAQEEARSVSENMRWRVKRNFEQGIPWGAKAYGYEFINGRYEIVEEEAEVIRLMYKWFLEGNGRHVIAEKLNEAGYKTRLGAIWRDSNVGAILSNYDYTGNLLLQKTYRKDYMCKKATKNRGEVTMYHAEGTHDAIIPLDIFNQVQEERRRRAVHATMHTYNNDISPFKGLIKCKHCGKSYHRKISQYRVYWNCATMLKHGIKTCPSKQISEPELFRVINDALGFAEGFDDVAFKELVKVIYISNDNTLEIELCDGTILIREWKTLSRRDSWTPEMKKLARERSLIQHGKSNSNTINH